MSVSAVAFPLTFLSYCLLFTIIILYCCIELSFRCCDTHISKFAGLIKEFLTDLLFIFIDQTSEFDNVII